ncbi:MFS transporter [Kerstersia sp.]|uniref:MFS transporter n=1 Tax=Kerstersia sp. TaxID=1930783 RepID=UPI003F91E28A
MQNKDELRGPGRATRLAFFIAGFGISSWAPLVPYAQARMQADAALLGSILLCLGLGAVLGMPTAGVWSGRAGTKPVIAAGALGILLALPLLAWLSDPVAMGAALLLFGAAIGAIDVAANIHGAQVQARAGVPLMSGFHGMYSLGGLSGASSMTALLALGVPPGAAAALASAVIGASIVLAWSGLMETRSAQRPPVWLMPRGAVLVIGVLAMLTFLAEGAMLDWGAVLLTQVKQVEVSLAGMGYSMFALAMAISRLAGDRVVAAAGERSMLAGSLVVTGAGILLLAWVTSLPWLLACIAMAGLAVGNVVPVLFSLAARQRLVPAAHAIAAASMLGYLGVLLGPALIGYAALFIGLAAAFAAVGALLIVAVAGLPAALAAARQTGD